MLLLPPACPADCWRCTLRSRAVGTVDGKGQRRGDGQYDRTEVEYRR